MEGAGVYYTLYPQNPLLPNQPSLPPGPAAPPAASAAARAASRRRFRRLWRGAGVDGEDPIDGSGAT